MTRSLITMAALAGLATATLPTAALAQGYDRYDDREAYARDGGYYGDDGFVRDRRGYQIPAGAGSGYGTYGGGYGGYNNVPVSGTYGDARVGSGYYGQNDYDRNGQRCRPNGTAGTIIGALAGGLLGNRIAGRGNRTLGTVIGGVGGGLAGRAIEKSGNRCR